MADKPLLVASDHAGFVLKADLLEALAEWGVACLDLGTKSTASVDYPDFAHDVAHRLSRGEGERALLVCGTGVGMAMAANRHARVRAVVCSETFSAKMARAHNDANVLCLGARVVGVGLAREILRVFLDASFEGGRHAGRLAKIDSA